MIFNKVNFATITVFLFCFISLAQNKKEDDSKLMKTFEQTISILKKKGLVEQEANPKKPQSMPKYSDENPTGIDFYSMPIENENLANLDLERTFFYKSEINTCNFENSKLKDSHLCWNDFYHTNFTGADLSGSDLRASIFEDVRFIRTNLAYADLRQSDFENCYFDSANMKGAKLTLVQKADLNLSEKQINEIDWRNDEGAEPEGG